MAVKACAHCGNDDKTLLEYLGGGKWRCDVCSKVTTGAK
jgi:hypothetical protein